MDDLFAGIDLVGGDHVDDDQRAGRGRSWRCTSPSPRTAASSGARLGGTHPERHPEGVPGAEGVHLPAAPVDAPRHRPRPLHDRRDAEVEPDLDQRLPHPRSGLDRRAGARVHARQRVRVRRGRASAPGSTVDDVRAAPLVLLQQPPRLLRGDRQVPRRAPHLGALDARRATARPTSARPSCGSTRRPPACRSPRSSPRSTSPGSRSRRWPRCWAARSRCTPTASTRRSRSPPSKAARIALRTQQVIAARDRRGRRRRSARRQRRTSSG